MDAIQLSWTSCGVEIENAQIEDVKTMVKVIDSRKTKSNFFPEEKLVLNRVAQLLSSRVLQAYFMLD